MENYKEIKACRVCKKTNLTNVLSLGDLYVSDFSDQQNSDDGIKAPLDLVLCNHENGGCGLLQLKHTVSNESMYRNYWYRSGINKTMRDELGSIASKAKLMTNLKSGDYVIDIGANDGTLLRSYDVEGLNTVGFEPALNLEQYGIQGTTKIIVDFFNFSQWNKNFSNKKAKVITAIGMFYDLDDPNSFVSDVEKCLDDDGLFIIQMMYLPSFLKRNSFDGICHEHLEYYSLFSLSNLLDRHNLEVCDVELKEHINEGSVCFYIRKKNSESSIKLSSGASDRVLDMISDEKKQGLEGLQTYKEFEKRIIKEKDKTLDFLKQEISKGKKIHGYAASTKGNTTLQFYKIDTQLIEAIADRNPDKHGKFTMGSEIPVISEEESRGLKPDYYFVLAWHFLPEFIKRESDFLKDGGKFVVSMPVFAVIDSSALNS
jgi:NDP-4-keto-2,6-dideoxyhexose 3-C-methyltransferase